MELLKLTYYPVLPDGPLENDDLDLQLVWLHAAGACMGKCFLRRSKAPLSSNRTAID